MVFSYIFSVSIIVIYLVQFCLSKHYNVLFTVKPPLFGHHLFCCSLILCFTYWLFYVWWRITTWATVDPWVYDSHLYVVLSFPSKNGWQIFQFYVHVRNTNAADCPKPSAIGQQSPSHANISVFREESGSFFFYHRCYRESESRLFSSSWILKPEGLLY